MNTFALPALVALAINSTLGLYVLKVNPKGRANRAYSLLILFASVWLLGEFMTGISRTEREAWLWSKFMMSGVVFIPSAFLYFTQVFPYETDLIKKKRFMYPPFVISSVFLLLVLTTDHIMGGLSKKYYGFDQTIGEFYPAYVAFFFLCILYGLLSLFRRYRSFRTTIEREQTLYVLVGTFTPTVLGGTVDIFLPLLGLNFPAFASPLSIFMAGLLAYAVVKYKLMMVDPVYECEMTLEGPQFRKYRLSAGQVYLVKETAPFHGVGIFADQVAHCFQGLCITDKNPETIRDRYGFSRTPILSSINGEAQSLEKLEITVRRFVQEAGEEGVILIDGLESLVLQYSSKSVQNMVLNILPDIEKNGSSLLLSFDPEKVRDDELQELEHAIASYWTDSVLKSLSNPIRRDIVTALV
jgi:hypothetical protein